VTRLRVAKAGLKAVEAVVLKWLAPQVPPFFSSKLSRLQKSNISPPHPRGYADTPHAKDIMGRELQKKKNKSSIPKARRKPASKKRILANPIIARNW
jgi:hypothetical protein